MKKIIFNCIAICTALAIGLAFFSCEGPTGPAGKQGLQGERGPQGEPGEDGVGEPGEPGNDGIGGSVDIFTVSYDSDGGSVIRSENVIKGGMATRPNKTPEGKYGPEGLYLGDNYYSDFAGWYIGDDEYDFEDSPVTENITLKAKWTVNPAFQDVIGPGTVAEKNIAYAINHPDSYTLLLYNDSGCTHLVIDESNVKLTILGIGGERKIQLSDVGVLFVLGDGDIYAGDDTYGVTSTNTGIELTLGNNITLVGRADNEWPMVWVQTNANFTMLEGSKITGNTNTEINGRGPGVYVYDSALANAPGNTVFTMKGGTITGNTGAGTALYNYSSGAYISYNGTLNMEGGSITGNTGNSVDVFCTNNNITPITFSGNSTVGTLTLRRADTTTDYWATINAGWTGSVGKLNLYGQGTDKSSSIGLWVGNMLLNTTRAADVAKFPLGDFIWLESSEMHTQPIGDPNDTPAAPSGFIILTANSGSDVIGTLVPRTP